jgi:hypothetical protein|tara:strand:- start:5530 stop:5679 length:150 start_codon:yes stop_codon:yes gene_type:complete
MPKENFIQEAIKSVAAKRRAANPSKPEPKPLNPVQQLLKDRGIEEKDLR